MTNPLKKITVTLTAENLTSGEVLKCCSALSSYFTLSNEAIDRFLDDGKYEFKSSGLVKEISVTLQIEDEISNGI